KWLTLLLLFLLVGTLRPATASAADATAAERVRLTEELSKLASRNAWSGVERTYLKLDALGVPLRPEAHLLGAKASLSSGDMGAARERLRRGLELGGGGAAVEELGQTLQMIEQSYGLVTIEVAPQRVAALLRPDPPFASHERKAIEFAQARVATERGFRGLLP